MKLVAFCEAPGDFQVVVDLVDRVLRDGGPSWIADVFESSAEAVRTWRPDGNGRAFFDLHRIGRYMDDLSVRPHYGHFDGKRGAAGALMARNVFLLARRLQQQEAVDAVVLVWDMDDQPSERREGLKQGRAAAAWATFEIVIGAPNAMREAWVLTGFEPESAHEIERLDALRAELGFRPNHEAHRLDASDEQAKHSAKRVLEVLAGGDRGREARCWSVTPLPTLRDRSAETGLREFLEEIATRLLPRLTRG